MSPTVAAGPVRCAVSDVPVVDVLTISTAFLYDSLAAGVASSPASPTGRYHALWSLLVTTSRRAGVLMKSCSITTDW